MDVRDLKGKIWSKKKCGEICKIQLNFILKISKKVKLCPRPASFLHLLLQGFRRSLSLGQIILPQPFQILIELGK